jgi:ectoine hydroxylase-related dioxygenase (phytanoyl-CoA dioxygenase family)
MTGARSSAIPTCSARDEIEVMTDALDAAGCLVITGMATPEQLAATRDELAPFMAAAEPGVDDPDDFYPGDTRRVTALVARSSTVREFVADTRIDALCAHHLGPNCDHHQLHVTAALDVGPGARTQILHREEDPFSYFPLPRPNMVLATMWAVGRFTADNGGTLLVPGSHRWDSDRSPEPDEVVSAEMPAGSVLIWLGGTLHGAGSNVTADERRCGVILTYSLGWLRQEENQYLDIPASVVAELPAEFLRLTGHRMHGALGFSDPSAG